MREGCFKRHLNSSFLFCMAYQWLSLWPSLPLSTCDTHIHTHLHVFEALDRGQQGQGSLPWTWWW
jgi:hypothetical protein